MLLLMLISFTWFSHGVSSTWASTDSTLLQKYQLKPRSEDLSKEYAVIAAVTHSFALIFGQIIFSFGSNLKTTYRLPLTACLVMLTWFCLQSFFLNSFESKQGLIYQQASLFFYDLPNSSTFFSLFSSCSYVIWLLAGFFVRGTDVRHVGIFPQYLQDNFYSLLTALGVSWCAFHFLVFPLWFQLVGPMMRAENGGKLGEEEFTHGFSGLVTISHTAAIIFGFIFTRGAQSFNTFNADRAFQIVHRSVLTPVALISLLALLVFPIEGVYEVVGWMWKVTFGAMSSTSGDFFYSLEVLISGTNLFSTSVMSVFYVGLLTTGYFCFTVANRIRKEIREHSANPHPQINVDKALIKASRDAHYRNVAHQTTPTHSVLHSLLWLSVLSFFGSPQGIFCLYGILHICGGFNNLDNILQKGPVNTFLSSCGITAFGSIITFLPFARVWDKFYMDHPELQCQQDKKPRELQSLWRLEVYLAVTNLFLAACLSSVLACVHIFYPGWDKIYFGVPTSVTSSFYVLLSTVIYFLWIDVWAYVVHRLLHFPWMYKNVHKLHHRWKQTTAFTSLALHPIEFLCLQGGVYLGLFVIPLHPAAITVNLLYIHYHNVVDHSGVYMESSLPWQPSSLYHDDHHRLFHINYGQSLTIWDKLGGTILKGKEEKECGENNFTY
ncbi:hypothetical protein TL16_g12878 [Triparma laevis f. inornata]|uniref:Fatty acid hydroxylase domain-containing protein n=2 Tax=Triparma laevis TaxID=1534972 RepID=A0A9W7F5I4_9STRA|nr:hypothetical protein TL16_g12878 [Triparma laevis f. inornata]GMI04059.1 hypothetical protein TrLO_g15732 [Triparma laevis f. longispina]